MTSRVDVTIIVPCRNESRHIPAFIDKVLNQAGAGSRFDFELLFVDGRSDDDTRAVISAACAGHTNIRIIDNPDRITPVAFNLGIRAAKGKYVCILGAHSQIAADYILAALDAINETRADNVGGPWRAVGEGYWGTAISLAFQSPFSSGGARSHDLAYQGPVDSVWGGFYRKDVFERIGLFDENLVRNQDDELNFRLIMSGGKIFQTPKIRYEYICRDSLQKLWKQYYQYGYYKVYILKKHGKVASFRHLIPSLFVLAILFFGLSAGMSTFSHMAFAAIVSSYAFLVSIASLTICSKAGKLKHLPVMPLVLMVFHISYGIGFVCGLCGPIFSEKFSFRV